MVGAQEILVTVISLTGDGLSLSHGESQLEIPQYLLDLFGLDAANGSSPFPWDRTYHEETDRRRELRLEGKLMLDELWDIEQLSGEREP
jgi:hypothetical protein